MGIILLGTDAVTVRLIKIIPVKVGAQIVKIYAPCYQIFVVMESRKARKIVMMGTLLTEMAAQRLAMLKLGLYVLVVHNLGRIVVLKYVGMEDE